MAQAGQNTCTGTLTGGAAESFTLSTRAPRAAVTHHGNVADVLYVRTDGTNPTSAGDEAEVILPGETLVVECERSGGTSVVRLLSAGAATVTVAARG